MASVAGVGHSILSDSFQAGVAMAKMAIERIGGEAPTFCLMYSTAKHDAVKLRDGVRSVIGSQCMIAGGGVAGICTNDHLSYEGFEAAIALIKSDTIQFDAFVQGGLGSGGEFQVGVELAKKIAARKFTDPWSIYLQYDAVRIVQNPFPLNMATPLVAGMNEIFKNDWPPAVGQGLSADMRDMPWTQWYGDEILQQVAFAVTATGKNLNMDVRIIHGCKPSGTYHTITKTDGPVVLEIDGVPALEKIAEMLGTNSDKQWEDYPLFITLGYNKGDKFDDFIEDNYANRMCMAIDKERKGLIMFEDDLVAGNEVQLMRRSIDNYDYIYEKVNELLSSLNGRKPILALYIDCAGRAAAYCGSEKEEAEAVQKALGPNIPLLGMYSGVELAKVGSQHMMALDWTGVLAIYSE